MNLKSGGIRLRDKDGNPLGKPFMDAYVYDGGDLCDSVPVPREWGPWRLDTTGDAVLYPAPPYPEYIVELEACVTSAQVLDRIMQISAKGWADDELVGGLIRALDDVLSPQANLCSSGQSKRISRSRAREMARDAQEERELGFRVYPERKRRFR